MHADTFRTKKTLTVGDRHYAYYDLGVLAGGDFPNVERLPFSLKILLENLLRHEDGRSVTRESIAAVAGWDPRRALDTEIAYRPARVLLQDFTGVPCVADLAAMRDAMAEMGGDSRAINPLCPVELVIDHSVQVDRFGTPDAFAQNAELEFERNRERYAFLKWGQQALANFRAVPPDTGIVHQINIEYLGRVVFGDGEVAYPDTVVGTDSHTTMANGLGILAWGVGGIEAEAAMLGQPVTMLVPDVIGFKFTGTLGEGVTSTDLVLTVTQLLRKKGVVGKFVEFYGTGLSHVGVADRVTIGNMSPEYGSTVAIFPIDEQTLSYLRLTGRSPEQVALVEAYARAQGLFRTDATPDPVFSDTLELDLGTVVPSLAGPRRPQDRVALSDVGANFKSALDGWRQTRASGGGGTAVATRGTTGVADGSVVIAAITSCTNTSNPAVMLGAGLLAKKAVERGLRRQPWVKTSLAPGSKVVTDYLVKSGLTTYLDSLGFALVGYGCTTCIGNSGPLPPEVARDVVDGELIVAAVLSGNRNFEGRIHPLVRANYLASPPLVVAYALAGRIDIDLATEPLGIGNDGEPVYLRDVWPSNSEIDAAIAESVSEAAFRARYADVFAGDNRWRTLDVPVTERYGWDPTSEYVKKPPYFDGMPEEPVAPQEIAGARVLAILGDSVTTDHISPAGSIAPDSPAARYLLDHGVATDDFNSYGARRGNHEVMVRGTFANVRLRNALVPGVEGGVTRYFGDSAGSDSGSPLSIYDAAMKYRTAGVPTIVLAGRDYGSGSSRDWAAKGPMLLGVRAVIAESFERIHRSNLIGMGILPLAYARGETRETLGIRGDERFDIRHLPEHIVPRSEINVEITRNDGSRATFRVIVRIETPDEADYFRHGGILPYVLRGLRATSSARD